MEFTCVLEKFDNSSEIYGLHIKIPDAVFTEMIKIGKDKRVVCTINGKHTHHAAMLPKGSYHFIMFSREVAKKMNIVLGDEIHLTMVKDDSKYGMPISEEMEEVLFSDPEGSNLFHLLTPGKQRSLIYSVSKIKNTQLRIERSFVILEHLKRQKGKLDYKILDADIKNHRNSMRF